MPFALLIMETSGDRRNRPKDVGRDAYEQMVQFAKRLQERGVLRAVESLKSDESAVRIETKNGKRTSTDGPFAEAKEMVGGFFLLDCTKEQAVQYAHECPAAGWAVVEVRETGPCFT
jgi:hypothetical protein